MALTLKSSNKITFTDLTKDENTKLNEDVKQLSFKAEAEFADFMVWLENVRITIQTKNILDKKT